MAHIILRPNEGALQLIINGVDYSNETYRGSLELVEVGDERHPEWAEVGLHVTFAVSRLDLGGNENVTVTDRFGEVAQSVRSFGVTE